MFIIYPIKKFQEISEAYKRLTSKEDDDDIRISMVGIVDVTFHIGRVGSELNLQCMMIISGYQWLVGGELNLQCMQLSQLDVFRGTFSYKTTIHLMSIDCMLTLINFIVLHFRQICLICLLTYSSAIMDVSIDILQWINTQTIHSCIQPAWWPYTLWN